MPKPVLLVTRKLPPAIEARAARDYDAHLNPEDAPWFRDGAEIARRATEAGAAGILCAAGDPLNAAAIAQLPKGAIVINSGRGGSVDDAALVEALRSGHVFAAGLDVFEGEPRIFEGYYALPNVVLLPHLGSATMEVRDAMGHRALENLDAVLLKGTEPPHRVA
jgi:hypothetical protein